MAAIVFTSDGTNSSGFIKGIIILEIFLDSVQSSPIIVRLLLGNGKHTKWVILWELSQLRGLSPFPRDSRHAFHALLRPFRKCIFGCSTCHRTSTHLSLIPQDAEAPTQLTKEISAHSSGLCVGCFRGSCTIITSRPVAPRIWGATHAAECCIVRISKPPLLQPSKSRNLTREGNVIRNSNELASNAIGIYCWKLCDDDELVTEREWIDVIQRCNGDTRKMAWKTHIRTCADGKCADRLLKSGMVVIDVIIHVRISIGWTANDNPCSKKCVLATFLPSRLFFKCL